ncbi:MAG: hypothetical protein CVU89_02905 [Firmicutes bacterium HGW-Firmicutes-14]|nr:MAG: hypothetical protein CVU89_02905 [Firmicutes bacterium HGW-Firmicutes-14]
MVGVNRQPGRILALRSRRRKAQGLNTVRSQAVHKQSEVSKTCIETRWAAHFAANQGGTAGDNLPSLAVCRGREVFKILRRYLK